MLKTAPAKAWVSGGKLSETMRMPIVKRTKRFDINVKDLRECENGRGNLHAELRGSRS